LNGISFLAADVTSEAFNRPGSWPIHRQSQIALCHDEISVLEREIEKLIPWNLNSGFVAESPAKLERIVRHFEAHLGEVEPVAPRCNAPWVSAVVETDGTVRPCFFHPPVGQTNPETTLFDVINGSRAMEFRGTLDVASNPVCRRCVCSLNWRPEKRELITR
jgi:MoaA/NifB/PqqE/SkfB family radical SAM enzyme